MCGRYVIALEGSALADALERRFGLEPTLPEVSVNYNAAPSQTLPVIVAARNAIRRLEPMR